MVELATILFWIFVGISPFSILLNIVPVVQLIRFGEAARYVSYVSLCINDIIYLVCIFCIFYQEVFIQTLFRNHDLTKVAASALMAVYFNFIVHMAWFVISQGWQILQASKCQLSPSYVRRRIVVIDLCLWVIIALYPIVYVKFNPNLIFIKAVEYVVPVVNAIYLVITVICCTFVVVQVKRSRLLIRRLSTASNSGENQKAIELKALKMYLVLIVNFFIFAFAPFISLSIYYHKSFITISKTIAVVHLAYFQLWTLSCPITYFLCFVPQKLKKTMFLQRKKSNEVSFRSNSSELSIVSAKNSVGLGTVIPNPHLNGV